MNLSRHLVYLEAQGGTPLMLRMPVDGALPSVIWPNNAQQNSEQDLYESSGIVAETINEKTVVDNHTAPVKEAIATVTAELRNNLSHSADAKNATEKTSPASIVQAAQVESQSVSFNFAIATAGALVLIDEIQPKSNRRQQQQLLNNIAQALSVANQPSNNLSVQFLDLNWPLKDHRALDHSDKGAFSFIQTWAESLTTRQHARFVVLLGETAKHWFSQALDELHLPCVVVPSTADMLEHGEKKAECWRLIRAYQALVSATPRSSTSNFE
jgi:hypothetical protein